MKVVVFNNGSLGFVELEMKATGFLKHGTDLVNPDFAKIAQGAGLFALHVDDPEEVRPALEQAMAHDGPALIDISVNRQELAMPPSLKLDQIVDFNLYMIRAILNGRGDEVIDLAPNQSVQGVSFCSCTESGMDRLPLRTKPNCD